MIEHPDCHFTVGIGLKLNLDDVFLLWFNGFFQKIGSSLSCSLKTSGQVKQFARMKPAELSNDGWNDAFDALPDDLVVILIFAHLVLV